MRMSRLWRPALACRTLLIFLVLNPLSVSSALESPRDDDRKDQQDHETMSR
jgi:hypothetical protein